VRKGGLIACALALGSVWLLLSSCASSEKKAVASDAEMLLQAEELLAAGKHEKAQILLKELMSQYPASDWMPRAQLDLARAYYEDKKYLEAKAEYQKFLDLHPQHQRVDEARYYLGLTHEAEFQTADRDPSPVQRALTEFEMVLKEAPDSQYAPEAKEKTTICRQRLAAHEFFVGKYYFQKGKYDAALGRFKYVFSHYPESEVEEKTLYYRAECLYRLEDQEGAGAAFLQLLEKFPNSEYRTKATRRLAELKAPQN